MQQGGAARARGLLVVEVLDPSTVRLTNHAAERAVRYHVPYAEIADAILVLHRRRVRNRDSADWLVRRGRLAVVYAWPDHDDASTARVITLWLVE